MENISPTSPAPPLLIAKSLLAEISDGCRGGAVHQSLLTGESLLREIWPDEASRPSLRWLREMQSKRALPFIKLNRLVFFEADRVRAALRKFEVTCH